jgi:hypothetical protein
MDPRVKVAPLALGQQVALEKQIVAAMNQSFAAVDQIGDLREQLKMLLREIRPGTANSSLADPTTALDKKAAELIAVEQTYPPVGIISVASINGAFGSLLRLVEGADAAPTAQANQTFTIYKLLLDQQLAKWGVLKAIDVPALNELLRQRQIPPIKIAEERGKPAFPTSRLLDLRDCFHVESLSGVIITSSLISSRLRRRACPRSFSVKAHSTRKTAI